MKALSISGSLRENVGKKDAKKHRKDGKVPCVLYGGKEQLHFVSDEKEFKKLIFTPEVQTVILNINGKKYNAVLQDIQYHPVTDSILHIDFLEIFDDKPVSIAVPVKLTGVSVGVLKGGKIVQKFRKVKIKALPKHLPDDIVIDITNLNINQSVKISDLHRDNIVFLDPPTSIVIMVQSSRGVAEGEGQAEAAGEA